MGKRRTTNQKNNGFTLIEIIVTLAIFAIIMGVSVSIFFAVTNSYTKTGQMNNDKLIGDSVYRYISKQLTFADAVELLPEASVKHKYNNVFTVEDGIFKINDYNIFGDDFYENRQVEIEYEATGKDTLSITVRVLDKNETLTYQTATTIRCINVGFSETATFEGYLTRPLVNGDVSFLADDILIPDTDLWFQVYSQQIQADLLTFLEEIEFTDLRPGGIFPGNTASQFINNEACRQYFSNGYSQDHETRWPVMPQSILEKNGLDTSKTYYIKGYFINQSIGNAVKPYINHETTRPQFQVPITFLYLSGNNSDSGDWATNCLFDPIEKKWYYLPNAYNRAVTMNFASASTLEGFATFRKKFLAAAKPMDIDVVRDMADAKN